MKAKLKGFKEHLPTKTCVQCQRPFQYRRKWKDNWEEVRYCSRKCRAEAKKDDSQKASRIR